MKSIIIITLLVLTGLGINAQNVMKVSAGTMIKTTGGVSMVLSDMDLENNGTLNQNPGEGGFRFSGSQSSAIKGAIIPVIGILEINKTNGSKLLLNVNINLNSSLNFISGQLDLNGNNILMNSSAMIAGESENNRIIGPNGGFVEITQNMNMPAGVNAGNLGATLTSSFDLGPVTVRRGHLSLSGVGLGNSIDRYYYIDPTNSSDLNATLRLKYFDAELNGQNENALAIFQNFSAEGGWNNLSQTNRNTNANYVEKTGIASLALQTLANDNVQQTGGVNGLAFSGQRKKPDEVTLKWTSQNETNMSGYQVQRRLKNEIDFSDRAFVNSLAPGGNSSSQLSYQYIDANPYTDTSYYRLKILTSIATFTYSNVIAVPAKTKGGGGNGNGNNRTTDDMTTVNGKPMMPSSSLAQKVAVGPNPNNGNFWFSVNGIEKETVATLYTIDGKQIKQFRVVNLQQQQVNNLRSGIYLLKVPGFGAKKIVVNRGAGNTPVSTPATDNNSKY